MRGDEDGWQRREGGRMEVVKEGGGWSFTEIIISFLLQRPLSNHFILCLSELEETDLPCWPTATQLTQLPVSALRVYSCGQRSCLVCRVMNADMSRGFHDMQTMHRWYSEDGVTFKETSSNTQIITNWNNPLKYRNIVLNEKRSSRCLLRIN